MRRVPGGGSIIALGEGKGLVYHRKGTLPGGLLIPSPSQREKEGREEKENHSTSFFISPPQISDFLNWNWRFAWFCFCLNIPFLLMTLEGTHNYFEDHLSTIQAEDSYKTSPWLVPQEAGYSGDKRCGFKSNQPGSRSASRAWSRPDTWASIPPPTGRRWGPSRVITYLYVIILSVWIHQDSKWTVWKDMSC